MTPQYLQTRDDTTTVIKVMGLTSTDRVLASARSASGVVTDATVASATVEDAVVFSATLPVLSTGRYELDVVSIASDGACSQLVRAILQVREGIASVTTAATTYEVIAATEVADIAVCLVAGSGGCSCSGDDSTASSGWVEIDDLNEITAAGCYKCDVSALTQPWLDYPRLGAGDIARVWMVGLYGSTVATSQLEYIEGDAPCLNTGRFATAAVSTDTMLTLLGVYGSLYVILAVEPFKSML